ncbi:unnamed protein product [Somion occarium]|uniref:SH3 domain-containing protein n=1 Tax=Somion occarium TaxID=3059160 RepID=A0ABP1DAM8_9APHY
MAQTNSPSPFFSTFSRASLSLLLLLHVAFATPPLVDFDRMGKVGIAGSFSGFTFLDNSSNTATLDPSTSTLLSRSTNGDISQIGSTNPGGNIFAGCTIDDTFYFAGSFSSIGGTPANNVASYKSSSGAVAAVGSNGPNGEVRALYCDASQKKVWAGGSFTSPARSVAVLDVASSSWSAPPFGGLSGSNAEVSSITTNSSHSSIFFAGSFVTSFGNSSIVINGTNNPNVPFSSGATPFSSSLVPVPLQNAQIDASPSTTESGFDNVSNILCPAGEDGPGNTWFARDGSSPIITVRKFSFLSASGIRIGNTFLDGRGTTAFSITTIPDNTVQTLRYTDPEDGNNKTCSNNCPLLTDPSVPYQDFLFNQAADITGFQLTLTEWKGDGPGLHLLQLLSSGASASAIEADNGVSCFAPNPSNSSQTGNWIEKVANTDIPGTIQAVLVSEVNVGTPSSQGPTFTWMPYVSASGQYDITLLVPGCTDFQDCALRTSVKVTVFPGDGLDPIIRTISQRNTENAFVSIYSGPIVPTSQTFVATITMALADNPEGSGQNGKYEIVADRVQLILTSANVTGNGSVGNPNPSAASQRGFGFFEWPLSSSDNVNASGILPNSSVTSLDAIGFEMFTALGGASATDSISAVAHHDSGVIFLAGDFNLSAGPASGASNIVAFKDGALTQLSNRGLNGPVTSLVVDSDALFIGGSFTDTASASTNGALSRVAIYDVKNNQWKAMEGGVNGVAFGLSLSNDEVTVVGNFSSPMVAQNKPLSSSASSFASWDVTSGNWSDTTGLIMGNLTFVTNNTSNGDFMAGHISASYEFGASGFALLQNNGDDGIPHVTALNLPLGLPSTTSVPAVSRRYHIRRTAAAILPRIGQFFKRQSPSTTSLTPLPTTQPISAPAILAGAFWTNSSSNVDVAIVGGNFTFTSASGQAAQDLAVYELDSGVVSALKGNQVNGSIHSLLVQGNLLFVGGTFTVEGTNQVGFAVYDLAEEQWDVTGVQPLQSGSNALVTVRSITASPSQSNVLIVAGSFASAGSTTCRAICSFDFSSKQWSALGSGIQGEVASVAYAGNTRDIIIASGSIALADSTLTNVAMYTIGNSTWSAIGNSDSLPGPVTAVEVNNGNSSSIFAAGKASDGSSTYLSYWDGHTWNSIGSGLTAAADVSQLIMVPLQNTHEANGVVEPDRMLMVSGSLSDSSFGNASSVLFDGRQFIPYILSASTTGAPGAISSLIHSISQFSFNQRHFLATGVVILISIAIAAGVVFLLALIGILWTLFSRRDDKINKFDPAEAEEDDSLHRPSSLLEHINAATRTTIFGGHDPFNSDTAEKEVGAAALASASSDHDPFGPDGSNYIRAETPSDAIMGMAGEEVGRAAHARYSFNGEGEGELRLVGGQEIEVLDDRDPAWWYARDPRSGQEGVVPAAYVY